MRTVSRWRYDLRGRSRVALRALAAGALATPLRVRLCFAGEKSAKRGEKSNERSLGAGALTHTPSPQTVNSSHSVLGIHSCGRVEVVQRKGPKQVI